MHIEREFPTDEELAWIAGFFDGEGSISFCKSGGRCGYDLRVAVSQALPDPLVFIAGFFGGTIHATDPAKLPRKKDGSLARWIHRWCLSGRRAYEFLLAIRPWLRVKDAEAERAFSFMEILGPRKKTLTATEIVTLQQIASGFAKAREEDYA